VRINATNQKCPFYQELLKPYLTPYVARRKGDRERKNTGVKKRVGTGSALRSIGA
jgi:hypothetical protein